MDTQGLERYIAKRKASYNPFKPTQPAKDARNVSGSLQALQSKLGMMIVGDKAVGDRRLPPAIAKNENILVRNQESRNGPL